MDPRMNCTNGTLDPPTFMCLQNMCVGPQAFDCGMNNEGAGVKCTCKTGFAGTMTTNMKPMCTEYHCGTGVGANICGSTATCAPVASSGVGVTCTCNTGYMTLVTTNAQPSCVENSCDSSNAG